MKEITAGIDIGGTNTKFGFVDREGKVLSQGSISTQKFEEFSDYLNELSTELRKALLNLGNDFKLLGIGVGAANGNYYKGTIEHATNLKWKGIIPLAELLTNEFDVPALVTNDANAAAVGEMVYGSAKGLKDFIVIT